MNMSPAQFDRWRVAIIGIGFIPLLVLPALGLVWLHQQDTMLIWFGASLACAAGCWVANSLLSKRQRALIHLEPSGPSEEWPPVEMDAWTKVEALAKAVDLPDWPLTDLAKQVQLGRHVIEVVATHYYPHAAEPIWELSVPHLLRIIELASRDVGKDIREQVPFSDRIKVGALLRASSWASFGKSILALVRVARMALDPTQAVIREIDGFLVGRSLGGAADEIQRWLLQEYVRRVGKYAIEVYSGTLRFADGNPLDKLTPVSTLDLEKAQQATEEPLRVLVLGQTNAGKSSLINALFGELIAAADVLPTTSTLCPYPLTREGLNTAIVTDSPGLESFPQEKILAAAAQTDMILWVCAANRADRALDRVTIDALRTDVGNDPKRHMPPITVALSHIDQLRPFTEWAPPYDLRDESNAKARSIVDAVAVVALDLALPADTVIPVCLDTPRVYNVEDALWSAMLESQSDANRLRLLRCLNHQHQEEKRKLLREQFRKTGRILLSLPGRYL